MAEQKRNKFPYVWFTIFIILFSSITGGVFLWAIGANYNLYWALGAALVTGGILFSVALVTGKLIADTEGTD